MVQRELPGMWNIFVCLCWGIVSAAPPLQTEEHECFTLLRENDYFLEEKSQSENQNYLRDVLKLKDVGAVCVDVKSLVLGFIW